MIVFNSTFLLGMIDESGERGTLHFVWAHEIGHILNGDLPLGRVEAHESECNADRFAGRVMADLGYSESQARAALERFPEAAAPTHPGRATRIRCAKEGWLAGAAARAWAKRELQIPSIPSALRAPVIERKEGFWVYGIGYSSSFGMDWSACTEKCATDKRCLMLEHTPGEKKCNLYEHRKVAGRAHRIDVGVKANDAAPVKRKE
jgi:hypothetical protein